MQKWRDFKYFQLKCMDDVDVRTFRVNFHFAVLPRAKLFPGGVKKICGARKGNFVH